VAKEERGTTVKTKKNENPVVLDEYTVTVRADNEHEEIYLWTTSSGTAIHTARAIAHGVAAGMEAVKPSGWLISLAEHSEPAADGTSLPRIVVQADTPLGKKARVVTVVVAPREVGGAR